MLIQHSSETQEHYAPEFIVEASRNLLGNIDLDPASNSIANKIVKANNFFTKEQDGLKQKWQGKIFLNPPGGKTGNKSNSKLFWEKLSKEWFSQNVSEAVFLAYSLEALQTTQDLEFPILFFPFCIPKKRIKFYDYRGYVSKSPTHANCLVFLPDKLNIENSIKKFTYYFSEIGMICENNQIEPNKK